MKTKQITLINKMGKIVPIVIDGIIGSGKSSLITKLTEGFARNGCLVFVVNESVEEWKKSGILQAFYEDPSKYGYLFQTKVFHDKVRSAIDVWKRVHDPSISNGPHASKNIIILCERWITTDSLFMRMLYNADTINDLEWKSYNEWWQLWGEVVPFVPVLFIYLRPSLDECMRRVRERNRDGENGVTLEYQRALLEEHDRYFNADCVTLSETLSVPILRIESDANFINDKSEFQNIFTTISNKLINTN